MREHVAETVPRYVGVHGEDGRVERVGRLGVWSIEHHRSFQQREERIRGFLTVDQRHARVRQVAAGILRDRELVVDRGKVGAQRPRGALEHIGGGRRFSAQVLVPQKIQRGGRPEPVGLHGLHQCHEPQQGRLGGSGGSNGSSPVMR